jgi:hypothetical protein
MVLVFRELCFARVVVPAGTELPFDKFLQVALPLPDYVMFVAHLERFPGVKRLPPSALSWNLPIDWRWHLTESGRGLTASISLFLHPPVLGDAFKLKPGELPKPNMAEKYIAYSEQQNAYGLLLKKVRKSKVPVGLFTHLRALIPDLTATDLHKMVVHDVDSLIGAIVG